MRELAERAYFVLCLALGRLLRSATYSEARIVCQGGERQVRKRRVPCAPLLVWLGGPLVSILDTGVRVLPQRDWEQRERLLYWALHGASIRIDADGVLVLPCLSGKTLAKVLEETNVAADVAADPVEADLQVGPDVEQSIRTNAIELAAVALADFHHRGFTHGDAMAENVLVDVEAGLAHWFDFETMHDSSRPLAWRRADDVRALLVTCLVRTIPGKRAEILQLVLDSYRDKGVARHLAESFASAVQRPLTFHLAQAALSFQCFREISRLLNERLGDRTHPAPQRPGVEEPPQRGNG